MLFSLVPFISFNAAEYLGIFWRRSKLVIIMKHFCVPLYLNQNGEGGVCGIVGYGLMLLLKAF